MNSNFSALSCRDTLHLILERLPLADLARASCVSRAWNAVASDDEITRWAFMAPWKLKEIVGKPGSGGFWRDNGIGKFAVSHKIVRGDSVASLAVKYSVQVWRRKFDRNVSMFFNLLSFPVSLHRELNRLYREVFFSSNQILN
ncbi:unnamed protein product [Linum tenue]|uniref:F-box domain-containing protein n=1 Tax=Linum tenue TaxID=586396 RepID=A0AAV0R4A0_9ROSI|nr:unnamed protein product [Linum tenue]